MTAPFVIHHGECLEVLRTLPDCSIDSICTDPPYGLSDHKPAEVIACLTAWLAGEPYLPKGKGFMGKTWDAWVPGPEVFRECLRVLKPGGHMLAFAGTRSMDLMSMAIRLAGFELRDSIGYAHDDDGGAPLLAWCYGCLTDDAEILTENGWKRGVDAKVGDVAAAWDSATGAIHLQTVEEVTNEPWAGDMVRFVNDDTDQILTPNHRVYHMPRHREMAGGKRVSTYGADWKVARAEDINRWNNIKLPLAGFHDGLGVGGVDYAALLGWVWTEGGFDKSPSTGVRVYQSESANPAKVAEIDALFGRVMPTRKRYDRDRTYTYKKESRPVTETCWFFTGELAERVRADLPEKRPTWDLLWRMTLAEKRAFYDAAMKGDGSGDDFYQKNADDLIWFQVLVATIGFRGKVCMRKPPRDGGGVCITPRATTELQGRHLKTSSQHYEGRVWCVKVPAGAFVARRNGKVFITGNSGFPKSLDVSKAIDKTGGQQVAWFGAWLKRWREDRGFSQKDLCERCGLFGKVNRGGTIANWELGLGQPTVEQFNRICEVLGLSFESIEAVKREVIGVRQVSAGVAFSSDGPTELAVTAPATESARQWEGWGTALKPAWEPILLARRPLEGTVAANVLAHGTGALNIDGCRVHASAEDVTIQRARSGGIMGAEIENEVYGKGWARQPAGNDAGRWPANVIHDGSDAVLAEFPQTSSGVMKAGTVRAAQDRPGSVCYGTYGGNAAESDTYGDKGSAARFFYAAKASRFDRNEGMEDPGPQFKMGSTLRAAENLNSDGARKGNTHPTVKPTDLMRYLCRLITPPGGKILDMYCGSGSTGKAGILEGFSVVLIDQDAESVATAQARCEHAVATVLAAKIEAEDATRQAVLL